MAIESFPDIGANAGSQKEERKRNQNHRLSRWFE